MIQCGASHLVSFSSESEMEDKGWKKICGPEINYAAEAVRQNRYENLRRESLDKRWKGVLHANEESNI